MYKGEFIITNSKVDEETLRISESKSTKHVSGRLSALGWTDKDTSQYIIYLPSLEITGYGENKAKANEMLNFSVKQFMDNLLILSKKDIDQELSKLKFKKSIFYSKRFSKAFINVAGQLQNFNAVDDKVDILTLEAA